jgi:dUTP pyrophosphatase
MDYPLLVHTIHPGAIIPSRGSSGSVGYDLYSVMNIVIPPQERKMISTGIVIRIPPGHYGRIAPRSGYAYKSGIDVLAGVIDPDYRGELRVILYNTSNDTSFEVSKGQRVAQLVLEKCSVPPVVVVDEVMMKDDCNFNDYIFNVKPVCERVEHIERVKRGEGGFGSTGTH